MRLIILAANIYSERATATIVSLCDAGYVPIACLCISTTNLQNVVNKARQHGVRRFAGYVLRRVGISKSPATSAVAADSLENAYVAKRIKSSGKDLANVVAACKYYDIPLHYTAEMNSPDAVSLLSKYQPDLLVYTGGGILRKPLIEIPKIGVLNAHSGLLPEYRGMNVSEWAVLNGDDLGITVHFIDPGIDTGRILFTVPLQVAPADVSVEALRHRIGDATVDALVEGVQRLATGRAVALPQEPGDGKQYFAMHQSLVELAEHKLKLQVAQLSKEPTDQTRLS